MSSYCLLTQDVYKFINYSFIYGNIGRRMVKSLDPDQTAPLGAV